MAAKRAVPAGKPGFPKTIGACIDRMYALEQEKKGYLAQAVLAGSAYDALEAHVQELYKDADLNGARGTLAQFSVGEPVALPKVEDWDQVYAYIVKCKAFYLLHKRMSSTAWRELFEAKKIVPGTTVFWQRQLSLTALKPPKGGPRGKKA